MDLKVIDKQKHIFRIDNNEYQFVKPKFLYKNFGEVITAQVKGSTMGWNIEGEFVSYNQIRELFKNECNRKF